MAGLEIPASSGTTAAVEGGERMCGDAITEQRPFQPFFRTVGSKWRGEVDSGSSDGKGRTVRVNHR